MDDITDTERYAWMLKNPMHARHLLALLTRDGTPSDFTKLLDRIMNSERLAGKS